MLMQSAAFLGFPNLTHFMDLRHQQSASGGRNLPGGLSATAPFFLSAHHHRLLLPGHPGAHQLHGQHRPGPGSSGSGSPQPMSAPGTPSPPLSPIRTTTSPAGGMSAGKSFTIDAILGLNGAGESAQRYPTMGTQMGPFDMSTAAVAAAVAASRVAVAAHQSRPSMSTSPGATRRQQPGEHPGRPTKSKRIRTIFTPEQLERLEAEFDRQQYMVGPERLYLAHALRLTEAQVKVWFQNRRIKWRKQHFEQEQQRLVAAHKHDDTKLQQPPPRLPSSASPLEDAELHSGSDEAGGCSSD